MRNFFDCFAFVIYDTGAARLNRFEHADILNYNKFIFKYCGVVTELTFYRTSTVMRIKASESVINDVKIVIFTYRMFRSGVNYIKTQARSPGRAITKNAFCRFSNIKVGN